MAHVQRYIFQSVQDLNFVCGNRDEDSNSLINPFKWRKSTKTFSIASKILNVFLYYCIAEQNSWNKDECSKMLGSEKILEGNFLNNWYCKDFFRAYEYYLK